MKFSKNQVTWARCHLVGLTSGIDWTVWSSGESGAASASVLARTVRKRSSAESRPLSRSAALRTIHAIMCLPRQGCVAPDQVPFLLLNYPILLLQNRDRRTRY